MAQNVDSNKLIEEIGEVLRKSKNNLTSFKSVITNKHAVVFLGNTRSGKSTLVNYVIGTKLEAFEERKPIFKIRKANESSTGPVIGQGSQSCTTIPGIYPLNDLGMVVVDAPGFDDNRSESQDIINALYINQIKYAKTVKCVLVCDINELVMDNIKGFTDLLEKAYALFPNFEAIKKSISIVFTKEYRNYSQSDIAQLLKTKLIDVDNLFINKQLVQYFIENNGLIAIFQMPSVAGPITNEIDINIADARVSSYALLLNQRDFRTALSSKSRLLLLKVYQEYLDSAYFEKELKTIISDFSSYFDIDEYVFASTDDELSNTRDTLSHVLNLFTRELTPKTISNMSDINNSLVRILPTTMSPRFVKMFTVLVLIDSNSLMEDAIKDKFIAKYKKSLEEILDKVKKLVSKIDAETEERRKNNLIFNASASTAGAAGGVAVIGEVLHRVFEGSRAAPLGIFGIIGAAVASISAGVAATSLIVQKETKKKRIEARLHQKRTVTEEMFS